ncbi:MAG: hypothetical protein H6Q90_5485 [Deltaproteobacteria bacterium]|nr:hypothetical protein [Deltaproteobacteria bacterium]
MLRALLVCLVIPGWVACGGESDDLARGLTITEVTLLQGPQIPLIRNGEQVLVRTAPVLGGRRGQIVVGIANAEGAEARDVTVRVELTDRATQQTTTLEEVATIAGGPTNVVATTLPFDASTLHPDLAFAVSIHERGGFESSQEVLLGARQPEAGSYPLDVRAAPTFRVVIVPMGTPGPSVTQEMMDRWSATLHAWLPVAAIEMTLAAPLPNSLDLGNEMNWGLLLGKLAAWRASAGLDPDVFAYALVNPPPLGTIGGIAASLAVDSPYWRVAAGIDTTDTEEATIVVHELGHALGRSHAPCGDPGGPDLVYPYPGASIGVPGIDLRDDQLRDPASYLDYMSYCLPVFVSDYGYAAAFRSLEALRDRAAHTTTEPGFVVDPRWTP